MKPSEETIEKFKQIYKDEFGEKISDSQAYEKFLRLVNLLRVLVKEPKHRDQNNELSGCSLFDEHFINDKLKE